MGTWISHLRIAENLLDRLSGLEEGAFTCGNLAPDSGVPNADWSAFDPPKEVTHFLRAGEDEGRIKDLEFYRHYVAGLTVENDSTRYSFMLGYFFHLLSDNLWALRIGRRFKEDYASLFAERDKNAWWELKKDWYDLDHRYVRDHPDSLYQRVFMRVPNPPPYLPFLPDGALSQQLDYIRNYYSNPGARMLDRPYPYLNEATMARYVDDTTHALLTIHHALQGGWHPDGMPTALVMLPSDAIAVYPPPLGDTV